MTDSPIPVLVETDHAAVFQITDDGVRVFYDLDALVSSFLGPLAVESITRDPSDEARRNYLIGFRDAITAIHESIPVILNDAGLD